MFRVRTREDALEALAELKRRQEAYPLAYARLWHHETPRTSQRRALSVSSEEGALLTLILGGNRTGKSEVAAMWAIATAAGRDAVHRDPGGPVRWVERWLQANDLPADLIPPGPGRVWVASPPFASAVEQIRPKLARWAPAGTRPRAWTHKGGEGELHLPGGGVVVSKAYRQFQADPQSWEGASIRGLVLDEQPASYANLSAGFARLVDTRGRALCALTPLRGTADWLYRDVVHPAPDWLRVAHLHGEDNPHIPQDRRELMLSAAPDWQRASRDRGAFTQPEGRVYPFERGVHVVEPFDIPPDWVRWMGIDWGGRAPHVVWAAEDPQGNLWVYRELAPRRDTNEPAIPARRLLAWSRDLEAGDEGATVYRVADCADPGAIQEAAEMGWWVSPSQKGQGSVLAGISLLEALLSPTDPLTLAPQEPRMHVFVTCPVLAEELISYRWSEARAGQSPRPDPTCADHGADALRYLVRHRQALGFR